MSAVSPAPVFTQVSRPWNTLRVLRASLLALIALDLLLLAASITGARVHRSAMQTVGKDSAPSIVAAQRIKTALADMDANAATDLIAPDQKTSTEARRVYDQRRTEAAQALIDAAQNITYGREERDPIERIQLQLGTYEARIQHARDLQDEKNPGAVAAYEQAANLLDNELTPAADELDAANFRHLDAAYSRQQAFSAATRLIVLIAGIVLVAVLLWLQAFLTDRTHRILNLPLMAATLVVCGLCLWSLSALGIVQRELKVARKDAFISIHALLRARSVAYSAHADERRYLLDPAIAAKADNDFRAKTNSLMLLPAGVTAGQVAENGLNPHQPVNFTGYLADELKNITFPGERESAAETVVWFGHFLDVDDDVRRLQNSGNHALALALCLGMRSGEANYTFTRFDDALNHTIDINRKAFDRAVANGLGALSDFEMKASATAAIIALLIVAGLMQRIAEYR